MNIVILSLIYHCLHSFNLHFNFIIILLLMRRQKYEKKEI